ncbi:MAG: hypothetical protein IJI37_04665 [Opitutales bacterium]|jgi:hypothetical protein|nr:hypothetical protein [Opitutales bacterium]
MKGNIFSKIAILAASIALCGCASQNARYIESGGARSIISTDKINMADWNAASASLVNDLLASGAIEKTGEALPVKIKVSRVINRTSNPVDTDLLTNQICMVLNNSGKAVAVSDDAVTNELAQYEAKRKGGSVSLPKLTITGKIMEVRESNSDMREVTYTFMLQVNHMGNSVWMGQKQIAKQQDKGLFGL